MIISCCNHETVISMSVSVSSSSGGIGQLCPITTSSDSVLIFQVNRNTKDMNTQYIDAAKAAIVLKLKGLV